MSDISISHAGAVATVTINRPARRNALDQAAWKDLGDAFTSLNGDPTIRGVVLTGAGGAFCAGDDIIAAASVRDNEDARSKYMKCIWDCYAAVSSMRVPVVAAVSGACMGGGCTLALRADFRIADKTARFGIPPAKLGIVYPPDSTTLLVAIVGGVRAKRLLYTGATLEAPQALAWNLADDICDADVVQHARDFLATIIENAPISIAASKLACDAAMAGRAADFDAQVWELSRRADASADSLEGSRAFAEKRKPVFTGR